MEKERSLQELENIELAVKAKQGDKDCYEILVKNYENLIWKQVYNFRNILRINPSQISREDLFSIGKIALLEAVKKYEPEKGASFTNFLTEGIKMRFKTCYKTVLSKENGRVLTSQPKSSQDENFLVGDTLKSTNYAGSIDEKVDEIDGKILINRIKRILKESEFEIFYRIVVLQEPMKEIALEKGVTRANVSRLYNAARKKLLQYNYTLSKVSHYE